MKRLDVVKAIAQLASMNIGELRHEDAHTKPETDEDLWQYIAAYCGFKIPRVAVCKNHVAPFQAIADLFFERVNDAILFANRLGGKTQNLAILHHLNAEHKPRYETASLGAIQEQAFKCYGYVGELIDLPWFLGDTVSSLAKRTQYRNGSLVQVLTGTMSGVNSPHPICVVLDEVELMARQILQEALSMPQSKRGYRAMLILTSTRKYPSGAMQRLLDEANERGYIVYPYCLFESCQKCTLPDCEMCKEAIRVKEGKTESWYDICYEDPDRHPQGKCRASDGFIALEDVINKFVKMDWDVFDAQWRCHKPGRKGLVFGSFDEEIHCKPELVKDWNDRLRIDRFERDPEKRELEIAITIDMGWADPLATLFTAKDQRDNLFLFDSIYESGLDLRDYVPMMMKKMEKYAIPPDFTCFCDERAPRDIDDMNKRGLKVEGISAPVDARISVFRQWLDGNYREGQPTICIEPANCKALCDELNVLHYKLDKEGNPKGELPDKGPDHLIDCAGYMMKVYDLIEGFVNVRVIRHKDPPEKPPVVPTSSNWMRQRLSANKQGLVPSIHRKR